MISSRSSASRLVNVSKFTTRRVSFEFAFFRRMANGLFQHSQRATPLEQKNTAPFWPTAKFNSNVWVDVGRWSTSKLTLQVRTTPGDYSMERTSDAKVGNANRVDFMSVAVRLNFIARANRLMVSSAEGPSKWAPRISSVSESMRIL